MAKLPKAPSNLPPMDTILWILKKRRELTILKHNGGEYEWFNEFNTFSFS
jgi:hypothetical protein